MTRQLKQIIEIEGKKIRYGWKWYLLGAILFLLLPFLNHIYLDGVYYNKIIEFREPVNPLAFRTDKDEYCPMEAVRIETSFCKTRPALEVQSNWWVSNSELKLVSSRTIGSSEHLPSNFCFPSKEGSVALVKIHDVPADATEGFHQSVGRVVHLLENYYSSTPRRRETSYATIPYYVKSKAQCEAEGFYKDNI
jgi:hypothetical protein